MDAKLSIFLEKGKVSLTSNDIEKYDTDCDFFMKEMGAFLIKDLQESNPLPNKEYMIVFFPVGKDNIINQAKSTNLQYQGKDLLAPFFSIHYDKNFQFKEWKKKDTTIPTNMSYMILAH